MVVEENKIFNAANAIEVKVYDILKTVIDPEVGINIVDLGLVYTISYDIKEGITVEMTLTSKGCPMGESIIASVKEAIQNEFLNIPSRVNIVWEPKWTTKCITSDGLEKLGN